MAEPHVDDEEPAQESAVVDLTDAPNQRWLDQRGPSEMPFRCIDDADERARRLAEMRATHRRVTSRSEPSSDG